MIHNLFSTLPTFKNLGDLKAGLNVVLAQKTEGASSKQTRNRAGKTSFIETVHFLTGSEAGPDSIVRTPELAEYTFGMDFDLKNARTVVERTHMAGDDVLAVPGGVVQRLGTDAAGGFAAQRVVVAQMFFLRQGSKAVGPGEGAHPEKGQNHRPGKQPSQ